MDKQIDTTNLFKELRENEEINIKFIDSELENREESLNYIESTERYEINKEEINIGVNGADLLDFDISDKRERIINILKFIITISILWLTYNFIAIIFKDNIKYIEQLYMTI